MTGHPYRVSVSQPMFGNTFATEFPLPLNLQAHKGGYKFTVTSSFIFRFCWDSDSNQPIEPSTNQSLNYVIVDIEVLPPFVTDLISSPQFAWSIIPPFGPGLYASVVHDLLYRYDVIRPDGKPFTQKDADIIFKLGLKHHTVTKPKRWIMYYMLRVFGFRTFNDHRKDKSQ